MPDSSRFVDFLPSATARLCLSFHPIHSPYLKLQLHRSTRRRHRHHPPSCSSLCQRDRSRGRRINPCRTSTPYWTRARSLPDTSEFRWTVFRDRVPPSQSLISFRVSCSHATRESHPAISNPKREPADSPGRVFQCNHPQAPCCAVRRRWPR